MLPPLLYSDKCNHSLFCTANTNSYAQKLNQVKKRVNFLLWKLKALSKILMTIRRFVHFQPNFFTHLVPLWLWVPGGRNSTCFTYHISPVSRHFRHKYWMKEGRNAFDSWAPGTVSHKIFVLQEYLLCETEFTESISSEWGRHRNWLLEFGSVPST